MIYTFLPTSLLSLLHFHEFLYFTNETFSLVDTLFSRKKGHITGMLFAILEDFYSFAIKVQPQGPAQQK